MIAQTYCGGFYRDGRDVAGGLISRCAEGNGPCPSCLRERVTKLEARNAELETQAAAQAGGVAVIPPLPKPTGRRADDAPVWGMPVDIEDVCRQAGNPALAGYQAGIRRGHAIAESSARAFPASRVLGERMRAVPVECLEALVLVRSVLFDHMAKEGGIPMTDALAGAMERIEAHEDALRAAKGGA